MVNIKQVAEASGVSTATVSRVLNNSGYVSEASKKKVLDAVSRLQYRPSAIARSLKQDKTNTIGVITPDISNPYFMDLTKGIEKIVSVHGYQMLLSSSEDIPEKEEYLLRLMYDKRVDVIVLIPCGKVSQTLRKLIESKTPVIVADRLLSDLSFPVDVFVENNMTASFNLTCKLIEQVNERRIAVIHGGHEVSTSRDRLTGFRQALKRYGIPTDEVVEYNGRYTTEGGAEAAAFFCKMDKPPTAILSLNNTMAYGALSELRRNGVRVPEQVSFASYGAIEGAAFLDSPHIWFVEQKPYEMGCAIGTRILDYRSTLSTEDTHISALVNYTVEPLLKCYR